MNEFGDSPKVVGLKQTKKAIKEGRAKVVYIANDADDMLKSDIANMCSDANVSIEFVESMKKLGMMCAIDVGSATAATLK